MMKNVEMLQEEAKKCRKMVIDCMDSGNFDYAHTFLVELSSINREIDNILNPDDED